MNLGIIGWFGSLKDAFGIKLLAAIVWFEHISKGFLYALTMTSMDFVLGGFQVPGPSMQIYKAVASLPWVLKAFVGLTSDRLPIFGFRKMPYLILSIIGGATAAWMLYVFKEKIGLELTVLAFFLITLMVSTLDLLTEAQFSTRMRGASGDGPALLTFVWGGIQIGALIAVGVVGSMIHHYGAYCPFILVGILGTSSLIPTIGNFLEEERNEKHIGHGWQLVFLAFLMGGASIVFAVTGMMTISLEAKLIICSIAALCCVFAFHIFLRPDMAKMNTFFFIQTSLAISTEGAVFYFFTDDVSKYPGGPHFSTTFYATWMGVAGIIANLIGVFSYYFWMRDWRYHSLFIFGNLLYSVLACLSVIIQLRLNVQWGIPDHVFAIAGASLQHIVSQWMWVPGMLLLSQLCPKGQEATMFALLAGCHNMGNSMGQIGGALMLHRMGVTPDGSPNEGYRFEKLWICTVVQTAAPLITLVVLPFMIPNASQTEVLSTKHATADSLWEQKIYPWWSGEAPPINPDNISVASGSLQDEVEDPALTGLVKSQSRNYGSINSNMSNMGPGDSGAGPVATINSNNKNSTINSNNKNSDIIKRKGTDHDDFI